MEMKSQMQTIVHQQQIILNSVGTTRDLNVATAKIPDGMALPLQTFQQTETVERKIPRSAADRQQLVRYVNDVCDKYRD